MNKNKKKGPYDDIESKSHNSESNDDYTAKKIDLKNLLSNNSNFILVMPKYMQISNLNEEGIILESVDDDEYDSSEEGSSEDLDEYCEVFSDSSSDEDES